MRASPGLKSIRTSAKDTSVVHATRPKRVAEIKRNELIIAIDYGTTFLTVAYLFISGQKPELSPSFANILEKIRVIKDDWSGCDSESATVPTETLYSSSSGRAWFGHEVDEAFERGEAPGDAKHVRLAKLLLHNAKETEVETKRLRAWAEDKGKDPFDFIEEFLGYIYRSIMKFFKEHHQDWLSRTDIRYVIGCPPAWSMSEHQKMADITTKAQMPPLFMGSEAEAQLAVYLASCNKSSFEVC